MARTESQPDPFDFVAFPNAAAGHDGVRSNSAGTVIIKPCTTAEIDFYESAAKHPAFLYYMPTFMGKLSLNDNQDAAAANLSPPVPAEEAKKSGGADWVPSGGKKLDTGLSIVLENVTAGFKKPNVIDLKLGARLWDDAAPEGKRRKLDEVSESTTSGSLGFRIAGMRVYRPDGKPNDKTKFAEYIQAQKDGYWSYDKFYGRAFSAGDIHEAFIEFFGGKETFQKPGGTKDLATRLTGAVRDLAYVCSRQEIRMYSASILIVYEGDETARKAAVVEERQMLASEAAGQENDTKEEESDDEDELPKPKVYDMRLIDFAHAKWTPGQGLDKNILQGVNNVLKILEQLTKKQ